MKMRIAAAAAIAIVLLLASYSALVGGAATDSQAGNGSAENTTRPVSVSPQTTVGLPLQDSRQECVHVTAAVTGTLAITVPSFCIGEICQISLWDDAWVGAFGPGLHMAVYYTQNPTDDTWIGGPSLSLGGESFSDGGGTNGDSSQDAIFGGGWTSDGNIASLYDDGETESSPDQWTISFTRNTIQEEPPSFYICPLVVDNMYERFDVSSAGEVTVTVPSFCIDGMCGILMWNDATMGAFGPGMHWPVYYTQNSAGGSWISGPNVYLAGVGFSEGAGINGDGISDTVYIGGGTVAGGYVRLHDDSVIESSPDQWTIEFAPDAYLTEAAYFVYALWCDHHPITVTGGTTISMPQACIDGVCTVLMWNDATMGAFGPGIKLPVYYTQSPTDDTWIGGPNVSIAGMSYSQGAGTNGDGTSQDILLGGQTSTGGYVSLLDDGSESSPMQWTAVFAPDGDLTAAAYYVCTGSCMQYDVPIPLISHRVRLPLVQRAYSP